ncbi:TolC family protein [uncultured Shewanella sp.]|uniref:TolC family protein n=1 Tax=uncultured Shewanella sp. TaxID=173975 RepID=UPI00260650F8|nr:TolC family protein [uncultured Shewanella sp.]
MKKTLISSLLMGYLSMNAFSVQVFAAEDNILSAAQVSPSIDPTTNTKGLSDWLPKVMQRFNALPEVQAQIARQQEAKLSIQAADKAVYNPEVGANYQKGIDTQYSLGLNQTIDWGDKRGAATRMAQLQAEVLLSTITLERNQMLSTRLQALATQNLAKKKLKFQQQQYNLAKAQLAIAKQRLQTGDLSNVEVKMMELDLANNAANFAMAEQASLAADGKVLALFGDVDLPFEDFVNALSASASVTEVTPDLPALKSAYQQVMLAKLGVDKVKAQTAADPTLSLTAGREGSGSLVGVGVSVPLQIRNNYSKNLEVASQKIAVSEQVYLGKERVLTQQQKQFERSLPRLMERYVDWRDVVQNSARDAAISISQQWKTGDISTSDYLQGQRQLTSSYTAGLTLEGALYQIWLGWMGESGQLERFIDQQLPASASK